jgi:hypothetical protein
MKLSLRKFVSSERAVRRSCPPYSTRSARYNTAHRTIISTHRAVNCTYCTQTGCTDLCNSAHIQELLLLLHEQPGIWDVLDIGYPVADRNRTVVPFEKFPQSVVRRIRNPPQVMRQLEGNIRKSEGPLRSFQTHCELPLGAAAAVRATDEARQCAAARRQGELRSFCRIIQPGEKGHFQQLVVVGDAGEKIFFAACEGLQQRMETFGFKHVASRERPAGF